MGTVYGQVGFTKSYFVIDFPTIGIGDPIKTMMYDEEVDACFSRLLKGTRPASTAAPTFVTDPLFST